MSEGRLLQSAHWVFPQQLLYVGKSAFPGGGPKAFDRNSLSCGEMSCVIDKWPHGNRHPADQGQWSIEGNVGTEAERKNSSFCH